MARRRRIQGRPLLVATAAAAMVLGCSGGTKKEPPPPGNLMPPPTVDVECCGGGSKEEPPPPGNRLQPPTVDVEVCVDTVPEGADVSLQAASNTVFSTRCETVEAYEGSTGQLVVEATGYHTQQQNVVLQGPKIELHVELVANTVPELKEPPVGNLMPPPPPPIEPVGNLMPPQRVHDRPTPTPEK